MSQVYDKAEADRIVGEASANLTGAVKLAGEQYGNPAEFATKASQGADTIYRQAINSAENDRIRARVQSRLADNYQAARNGIAFDVIKKKHDVIRADFASEQAAATRQFVDLDDAGKELKTIEIRAKALDLANSGVFSHEKAEAMALEFENKSWYEDAAIFADRDPIKFQDETDKGRYRGKLTGQQIQSVMDITSRRYDAQQAKDRRKTAASAATDEQDFYDAAKDKRLDEDKLAAAQRLYGWPEEKVNAIRRVALGLRASNPHAELLIAHASRLPENPTGQDIRNAMSNMNRLVERNGVSPLSVEFTNRMQSLRSYGRSATAAGNQQEAQLNQARSQARRDLGDQLNATTPDMDTEERRQLLGKYNVRINNA